MSNMKSSKKDVIICVLLLFLNCIVLAVGILSVWAVIPYLVVTVLYILSIRKLDDFNSRNATAFFGLIVGALSPAILVSWAFRLRERYKCFDWPDDLTGTLILKQSVEFIAVGMIIFISTTVITNALRARKKLNQMLDVELNEMKNRGKSFRQKVRDGEITSNVDRPIIRSPKR